ncbi:hypothetical protein [Anaeromyxobacter diazotrophicus]|uniref:Leucine rich repeat variant n=1 Tax=Anaeromyxobacter diazotrophicus TaxID=2590199 RepID=A0A7I9VI67_9BACT|nr:hypothetical protein [Anaeromyxobacter diazotrophicus]GEJ56094.1 hypothetical protein AMYX_08350 [Anaeromyxobacter diazotrophicus]
MTAAPGHPPALADARALARRLGALEEGAIRARAAARALAALAPGAAAGLLEAALRAAAGGEPEPAAALAQALLVPGPDLGYEALAALYAAAADAGLDDVRRLLLSAPPRLAWQPPRDRADARLARLTLGHKKALARRPGDPDLLARLAAEGDPAVVRELLRNPHLTEELVVRIAARRPCRPETLRCLHEERRWRARPAVARAIAHNPYAEPALVAKLLPRLSPRELSDLAEDGALHAMVRALAASLAPGRAPAAAAES